MRYFPVLIISRTDESFSPRVVRVPAALRWEHILSIQQENDEFNSFSAPVFRNRANHGRVSDSVLGGADLEGIGFSGFRA
jgi:hypothetical protein